MNIYILESGRPLPGFYEASLEIKIVVPSCTGSVTPTVVSMNPPQVQFTAYGWLSNPSNVNLTGWIVFENGPTIGPLPLAAPVSGQSGGVTYDWSLTFTFSPASGACTLIVRGVGPENQPPSRITNVASDQVAFTVNQPQQFAGEEHRRSA
jgi:hypothetical protein